MQTVLKLLSKSVELVVDIVIDGRLKKSGLKCYLLLSESRDDTQGILKVYSSFDYSMQEILLPHSALILS